MQASLPWRLRQAGSADAADIAALIRAAFATYGPEVRPPPSALRETADSVAAQLAMPGAGGMVAEAAGLAGSVLWEEKEGGLYLARLAVDPAWRGQGIARALVGAVEAEARRLGLPRVHLGTRLVLADNRRLFARCGFREIAEHAHPGFTAPTWVEMEKRLD